jgi:hypothetical protein
MLGISWVSKWLTASQWLSSIEIASCVHLLLGRPMFRFRVGWRKCTFHGRSSGDTLSILLRYLLWYSWSLPRFFLFLIVYLWLYSLFRPSARHVAAAGGTSLQMLPFSSSPSSHVSLPYCRAGFRMKLYTLLPHVLPNSSSNASALMCCIFYHFLLSSYSLCAIIL